MIDEELVKLVQAVQIVVGPCKETSFKLGHGCKLLLDFTSESPLLYSFNRKPTQTKPDTKK